MPALKNIVISVFLSLMLVSLFTAPVLAHRMLIKPVEDGVIKVAYEDGRFSRRTEVFVYDHQGVELYSGKLDEHGYFHYPPEMDAALIVADDGLGHRVEWRVGDPYTTGIPRGITVAGVVTAFCLIAAFFHLRVRKKRKHLEI